MQLTVLVRQEICGGTTCIESVKGKVALLTLDTYLINELQVTSVWFVRVDLLTSVDLFASAIPASTLSLGLENCVITEFSRSLSAVTALHTL